MRRAVAATCRLIGLSCAQLQLCAVALMMDIE